MRASALTTLFFCLACGGLADEAPDGDVPVDALAPVAPSGPTLLVLEPVDGCTWTLRSPDGASEVLTKTDHCPEHLLVAPDGSRLVAASSKRSLWFGAPSSLEKAEAPSQVDRLYVVDGKPVVGRLAFGKGGVTKRIHTLDGGSWSEAVSEVSPVELEMSDPLAHVDGMETDWKALGDTDPGSKNADLPEPSEALRAVVHAQEDDVGQLAVGGGFLTWRVIFGDSPHPAPPVFWCGEETCAEAVQLEGELPSQLALHPRGEVLLVTEEYSGASPRLYRAREAAPIWTGPEGSLAMWWPGG